MQERAPEARTRKVGHERVERHLLFVGKRRHVGARGHLGSRTFLARTFRLPRRKRIEILPEIGRPKDIQRLHRCAYIITCHPLERFHVPFAKNVARRMRVGAPHVERGPFRMHLRDNRKRWRLACGKLHPDHAPPPDFRASEQPGGHPVGIDGGRLRDIDLAEPLQGFRGAFDPNLLGRFRFGYAFCHFTPKDR